MRRGARHGHGSSLESRAQLYGYSVDPMIARSRGGVIHRMVVFGSLFGALGWPVLWPVLGYVQGVLGLDGGEAVRGLKGYVVECYVVAEVPAPVPPVEPPVEGIGRLRFFGPGREAGRRARRCFGRVCAVKAEAVQLGGQAIDPEPEEGWVHESCHGEEQAKAAMGQGDGAQQAQVERAAEVQALVDGPIIDLLQGHVWGHRDARAAPTDG